MTLVVTTLAVINMYDSGEFSSWGFWGHLLRGIAQRWTTIAQFFGALGHWDELGWPKFPHPAPKGGNSIHAQVGFDPKLQGGLDPNKISDLAFSPTRLPPSFIVQPHDGALA